MIKVTVQGDVYEFDGDTLLLAEAREIKTFTGMSVGKWSTGIDEGDVDAIQSLIYLAKKRAGETMRYSDLDRIDFADIDLEHVGDEDEDEAAEAADAGVRQQAADPTPPGDTGTIPTPATTATLPPSPGISSTDLATSAL